MVGSSNLRSVDQASKQMSMNIEAQLVDKRAFLHSELNFVDKGEVRVRNLMILNDEVRKGHILASLIIFVIYHRRRRVESGHFATKRHLVGLLPSQNITKLRLSGIKLKVLTEVSN